MPVGSKEGGFCMFVDVIVTVTPDPITELDNTTLKIDAEQEQVREVEVGVVKAQREDPEGTTLLGKVIKTMLADSKLDF